MKLTQLLVLLGLAVLVLAWVSASPAQTQTRWEYAHHFYDFGLEHDYLDKMGTEGWELVAVAPRSFPASTRRPEGVIYYFKRKK